MSDRTHLKFLAAVWAVCGTANWLFQGNPTPIALLELAFAGACYIASFFAGKAA